MMINGTDYSLPLLAVLSFLLMFIGQYLLLRFIRLRFLRHLPWIWVGGVLAFAMAGLFGDTGGWIDLRAFFAAVLAGYAAICAAGIGLAHLVFKSRKR
ncbi:MAG: hypothetical protein IJX04_05665 [Oscillospiraceae bacterium]|mgnify:CR=1 FL=1|nr:hypothetical protein [Oscillospiraceae bacterium]